MCVLLGIETSTDACSVAVRRKGRIIEDHRVEPRRHNELILRCIDELLRDAGVELGAVDALAFGRGPGSFTGLRIAAGVAQGLAFALDVPVIPVSTLETLAAGAAHRYPDAGGFVCVLPARPGELYVGIYAVEDGRLIAIRDDALVTPASFQPPPRVERGWHLVGDPRGATLLEGLAACDDPHPHAGALLELAYGRWTRRDWVSPLEAVPVYLQAQLPWRKSHGSG